MLFLVFQLGSDRYALEASRIVEVVPFLDLKRIPRAPTGVAGLFNYRGHPVPVVDLCALTLGHPAAERLSTRIIVVNHSNSRGESHLLGLIAEHATEIIRKDARGFAKPGMNVAAAPYLGPVYLDRDGAIQWLHEQRLLPEPLCTVLFSQVAEMSHDPD